MNASAPRLDLVTVASPQVDRRVLSQAWYDALHLAGAAGAGRSLRGRSTVSSVSLPRTVPLSNARLPRPGKVCSPTFPSRLPWLREKLERLSGNDAPVARPPQERRSEITKLARDIASKINNNPSLARFVLNLELGRVVLHVVRSRDGVKMFALCAPALRGEVEKALAQARFALTWRGTAVQ